MGGQKFLSQDPQAYGTLDRGTLGNSEEDDGKAPGKGKPAPSRGGGKTDILGEGREVCGVKEPTLRERCAQRGEASGQGAGLTNVGGGGGHNAGGFADLVVRCFGES